MTDQFDRDLEAVFDERAVSFSGDLRDRLRQLWRQGVLEGRALERKQLALDISNSWYDPKLGSLVVPMKEPLVRIENGFFTWTQAGRTKGARDENRFASWTGPWEALTVGLEEELAKPKQAQPLELVINDDLDARLRDDLKRGIGDFIQALYNPRTLREFNNEWVQKLEPNSPRSTVPSKKGP